MPSHKAGCQVALARAELEGMLFSMLSYKAVCFFMQSGIRTAGGFWVATSRQGL